MEIVIILLLIILNGTLSMSEIALVSARKSRLETEANKGNKSARTALILSREPDKFLSTIQIGITLIGILTGLYSGENLAEDLAVVVAQIPLLQPHAFIISQIFIVIVVTYLTLIVGELVPKRIGMGAAEKVAMLVAKPMNLLSKIASPFVWLLSKSTTLCIRVFGLDSRSDNRITEEEIKAIIQEGTAGGEIQEVEQDIVERVFNLGDRNVGTIMTHRNDLMWIDVTESNQEIKEKVKENLFTVYPVADGKIDDLVGVVQLKDLFDKLDNPEFSLRGVVNTPLFLPENMSVYNALEQMKSGHSKYGIVIDEFGSVQGIVTLSDIMEALLGAMPELGEEEEIVEREDGSWLVDGQCNFYNLLSHFDLENLYAQHSYNTLSGLILNQLERIPRTGEKLHWLRFEFEIVDMDGARIDKVLVRKKD